MRRERRQLEERRAGSSSKLTRSRARQLARVRRARPRLLAAALHGRVERRAEIRDQTFHRRGVRANSGDWVSMADVSFASVEQFPAISMRLISLVRRDS